MTDTIPVENEDLAKILEDPAKYKDWVIEILNGDPSKLAQATLAKLETDSLDKELDMLLRQLGNVMPYNFIIPGLRDQLGLSLNTDKECSALLRGFKEYLDPSDQEILNQIINYIDDPEGELDENFPDAEIYLLSVIESLPVQMFPEVFNCIDYIAATTEIE